MITTRLRVPSLAAFGLTALAAGVLARADHTVDAIPLAPHGDSLHESSGALPLTPDSFVVAAEGDDGQPGTADDKLLIVTDVAGVPVTTASVVGVLPRGGSRWARVSATLAVYQSAGVDEDWATGDEDLVIVRGVGSSNTVTKLVVGSMQQSQGGMHTPVRLSADTLVVPLIGTDDMASTADDVVALVTDLRGTPTVTPLAAPFLYIGGRTEALAVTPTSFLIASNGPDGQQSTADDVLYLFTDVGGTNQRTDISIPGLHQYRPGRPVRVTSTLAVVISAGPDATEETADDRVYVISDLGGTNAVTSVSVPFLACCGASRPRVLGPDLIAVPTRGADNTEGTADDDLAFVSDLGGTNTVDRVVLGPIDEDRQGRPIRLAANLVAVVTEGVDRTANSADDRLAIVADAGGANTVTYADVPGIHSGGAGEPIAISSSAVVMVSGGADGRSGAGNDDVFTVVSALGTATPVADHELLGVVGGEPVNSFGLASRPAYAGGGRAFASGTGPDGSARLGDDDVVHVLSDLPTGWTVSVKKLQIKFKESKPQKGEKFKVKADLMLDDPALLLMNDVTISIGNAAETIAADAFVEKKGKPTYKRPKGGDGFIKKVVYNPNKGTLTVAGKGVATGGETTAATFIPFTIDVTDRLFVGETVVGDVKKSGLIYKRPK